MQIKAILVDLDGTLVDSNDLHVLAWEEAFAGIAAVALRSGGFSDDILWNAGAIAIYDDVAALLTAFAGSPLAC